MRPSFRLQATVFLVVHALVVSTLPLQAQEAESAVQQQTRPRRVHEDDLPSPVTSDVSTSASAPVATTSVTGELTVRIGLATNARSVTISTNGRLLNATDQSVPPVPLTVARVRI